MQFVVCAVMDRAAQAFHRPMFVPSRGIAIRSFIDEVNRGDKDNVMWQHPEDFDLYICGAWTDETGRFEMLGDYEVLVRGKDAVRKTNGG